MLFSLRVLQELKPWINAATPAARSLARKVLQDASPEPLSTHQIFKRTQEVFPMTEQQDQEYQETLAKLLRRPRTPKPPSPHPIRSHRYLKLVILPDLAFRDEAIKIHRVRPATPEEREISASLKPYTRSQRKNRGARPPGQIPVRVNDNGEIEEWLWRLKTPQDTDEANVWKHYQLQKQQKRAEAMQKRMRRVLAEVPPQREYEK